MQRGAGRLWYGLLVPGVSQDSALYHTENYPATLPGDEATGTGDRTQDWPHGLRGESSVQAVCRIGIMRSDDGGLSWTDRGILLEDLDDRLIRAPINRNWTFPGGVGDPSAVACGDHLYVCLLYTSRRG